MRTDYATLENFIQGEIEEETLLGASIMIYINNENVFSKTFGTYSEDSIYRIYSMSKIITSIAILKLWEEERLQLDDPVSKYFPSFKELTTINSEGQIRKAQNILTIQDLLNMTSGLGYPVADGSPCELAWLEFEQMLTQKLQEGAVLSTSDICNMMGYIPCEFEPGTNWKYGASADLLGGIIEQISGVSFNTYLKETIFQPLEMSDTDFYIPVDKLPRLAPMYTRDSETGKMKIIELKYPTTPDTSEFTLPDVTVVRTMEPAFLSGGAGLYCTIQDYQKILTMLLNKGTYQNQQILKASTVEFLHTDQHSDQMRNQIYQDHIAGKYQPGFSYCNLVRIMKNPTKATCAGFVGNIGEFGWDGLPGNYCLIDPKEQMTMIFMIQVAEGAITESRANLRRILYSHE